MKPKTNKIEPPDQGIYQHRPLIAIVGAVVTLWLAGYGLHLVYTGLLTWQQGISSELWPQVEGQVLTSSTIREFHVLWFGTPHYDYYPKVRYWYLVNRKMYTSDKVSFGATISGASGRYSGERILKQYPQGRYVAVFYRPSKPELAVLEPGIDSGSYVMVALGVILIVAAAVPVSLVLRGM